MRGRSDKSHKLFVTAPAAKLAMGLLTAAVIGFSVPAVAFSSSHVSFTSGAVSVTEVTRLPSGKDDGCEQLLDLSQPLSDSELQDLYDCYADGSFAGGQGQSIFSYIDPFWLSIAALLGIGSLAMVFMGFGAPRAAISGALIDSREGVIRGAEVALATPRNESAWEWLANAPAPVSESERQRLEDSFIDYVSTTSNAKGQFRFSHVKPGWYWLNIKWELNRRPDSPGLGFNWETKGNFLIAFSPEELSMARPPKKYRAWAHKVDKIYFSGDRDLVIDFEYMN